MSSELQETLDYESKIDRSSAHIEHLVVEGEHCARAFLRERARSAERPLWAKSAARSGRPRENAPRIGGWTCASVLGAPLVGSRLSTRLQTHALQQTT
jgi:hypothetical protein